VPALPCSYGARALETAYGVSQNCTVTSSGVTGICGQGQTIVIVDAYGSPTLQQDVNAYDSVNGLPALTVGQNLTVVSPPGIVNKKESKKQDPLGWQAEVTLDVENAHAIAPGANIVLVASPNNYADLDEALNTVVVQHLGNIVTSSWGSYEVIGNPAQFNRDERILQTGALEGIGFNFSSGDDGDESGPLGGATSVDYPASSPFATAVGGTSLFLNSNNSYLGESGWGTFL
jgi:subtilase family serine protease